nr:hypothetical protein [Comamonas sp. SCN 65-56]
MLIMICPAPRAPDTRRAAGQHQHVLLKSLLEDQLIGPRGVVQRKVARVQHGAAPVLNHGANALRLNADQKTVFGGGGNPCRGASHALRAGGDTRELQRGQAVDADFAFDGWLANRGLAIELDIGAAHRVRPVGQAVAWRNRCGAQAL